MPTLTNEERAIAAKEALEGNERLSFLSKNILIIAGINQSEVADFYLRAEDLEEPKLREYYQDKKEQTRYRLAPSNNPNPLVAIRAHNIRMLGGGQFAPAEPFNVKKIQGYRLPRDSKVKIAVTGMLSGCSFVTQRLENGDMMCAHIQPRPGDNCLGEELQDHITENGKFEGVDSESPIRVLGLKDYKPEGKATVLGFNINGEWEFYAQIHDAARMSRDLLELDEGGWQ